MSAAGSGEHPEVPHRAGWNVKVALVIDDVASVDPWSPRFLRIYGTAELVERRGRFGHGWYMRIIPTTSWSWNLDGMPSDHEFGPRRTVHEASADRDS
jgi:pyridoxamine 5'-phosphate oxidase family protein